MSDSIHIQYHTTPVGELILGVYQNQLCLCDWRYRKMRASIDNRIQTTLKTTYQIDDECAPHPVIDQTIAQLGEYFAGQRTDFDLPILMVGTDFQRTVWLALQTISFGTTSTYLRLAKAMDKPLAVRAVASANGANALSIIVPCHRVIGSQGDLVGYAGGLPAKKRLLQLEQLEGLQMNGTEDLFASQ